jgi:hypothetical protein
VGNISSPRILCKFLGAWIARAGRNGGGFNRYSSFFAPEARNGSYNTQLPDGHLPDTPPFDTDAAPQPDMQGPQRDCPQLAQQYCSRTVCGPSPGNDSWAPLFALKGTSATSTEKEWRCYAEACLTADHTAYRRGSGCKEYCTRNTQILEALKTCKLPPPAPPTPPPAPAAPTPHYKCDTVPYGPQGDQFSLAHILDVVQADGVISPGRPLLLCTVRLTGPHWLSLLGICTVILLSLSVKMTVSPRAARRHPLRDGQHLD